MQGYPFGISPVPSKYRQPADTLKWPTSPTHNTNASPMTPIQSPSRTAGIHPRVLFLSLAALAAVTGLRAQSTYATPYTFSTLAGQAGVRGYNDGTGVAAHFFEPKGMAVDSNGNVYVADNQNFLIRKITSAGVVSTLAGLPVDLYVPSSIPIDVTNEASPNGTGSAATIEPFGIVADRSGNLWVTDGGSVRKVTPAGVVTTFAGGPLPSSGATSVDGFGTAAVFNNPNGIAIDSSGNLYVADSGNDTIRKITPDGNVTTLAGLALQFGDTDGTGSVARFSAPGGVAVDASGNVFVADTSNRVIRKVTPAGVVTTLAGTAGVVGSADGTGPAAQFKAIYGICIDASGNLYVTDADNTIRMVTSAGVVTTLAGTPNVTGSADGTGAAAQFSGPYGVAVDASGDLFVADSANDTIRVRYAAPDAPPSISTQPVGQSVALYSQATFSVTASGVPVPTYQWFLNGVPVAGATNPTLSFGEVLASNLGTYSVAVSNSSGTVNSDSVTLSSPGAIPGAPSGPAGPFFANISTRAVVGTGAAIEIAGFVVTGPPGSTEQLLVRADGLSLLAFDVSGWLTQPVLTIFDASGTQVATNVNWAKVPSAIVTAEAAVSVGAFLQNVPTPGDWDSALVVNLAPGAYTAQVSGQGTQTGVALVEVYQVGSGPAQLSNISTRASVGTGSSVEIAGLVVRGSAPTQVLIRAVGPTLANFTVSGVLAQPTLTVKDASGNTIATNTGWSTNSNAAAIASETASVGAFALPAGSADCALLLTLPPGTYTAIVSGVGGTSGIALVEAYQAP
jgi:sugar lactone lactonase YvrE